MVTFKLQERETGLRAVGAGPRGWDIKVNGKRVGSVSPLGGHLGTPVRGWYYVAHDDRLGIPHRNTCGEVGRSADDVKKDAKTYVKECLAKRAATVLPTVYGSKP